LACGGSGTAGCADRVRQEVVDAQVRTHAYFAQINVREKAVRTGLLAQREDLARIRSNEGLPIETLDSVRLLREARRSYIKTIVEYNRAHFQLYTALGSPPADMLVRNVDNGPHNRKAVP